MTHYSYINRYTLEKFDEWDSVPCSRACHTCALARANNGTNLYCIEFVETMPFEELLKYGYIRIPVECNPRKYIKPEDFNTLCDIKENITLIKQLLTAVELKTKNLIGHDYYHDSDSV